MNALPERPIEPSSRPIGAHPLWLLPLAALLAWHGWLTLSLFGPDRPWERMLDPQPLTSGRHPLHLYHGFLGARSLYERGTPSCFDPSFHAGYPKTPIFDGGCRPAELALYLNGGTYDPAVYKIAVALFWGLAPVLFWFGARASGQPRGGALLATLLGLLVWWGGPCREALEAGDLDVLLASVLIVVQTGWLIRYHESPGPASLLGITVTGVLGWFAQPMILALTFPLFLIYYISAGPRHRLTWHSALLGGLFLGPAVNAFWLCDWVAYWWIRIPLTFEAGLPPGWGWMSLWKAPQWGGGVDRAVAGVLLAAGGAGVLLHNTAEERVTARLYGLATLGLLLLALAGLVWEPVGKLGAAQLLVPALLFATLPAAHALATALRHFGRRPVLVPIALTLAAALAVLSWRGAPVLAGDTPAWIKPTPLTIGLDPEREAIVEAVKRHTTNQARILWEDCHGPHRASQWTPLLPRLTDRAFIGGLDPDAGIEHTSCGLVDNALAKRPLDEWSDTELAGYCDRYNIGWVVAWSPLAQRRFNAWAEQHFATRTTTLHDPERQYGVLYEVQRRPSFARIGSIGWMNADARCIVLGEVMPEKGVVLLSLHYQAGMHVSPSRVQLSEDWTATPADDDNIPFIKLKMDDYIPRLTITWDRR
jgi:hypothetical protein